MNKKLLSLLLISIILVSLLIAVNALVYQINYDRCRMCGRCTLHCPNNAILFNENTGFLYIDASLCDGCGNCVQYCPYGAIYSVTGNAEDSQPVPKLSLNCYPNPMTSFTKIKIELPKGISTALLKVSNSKGQIVYQNQVNSRLAEIQWQGKDIHGKRLPAGIYFVTLFCGKAKVTHKLTLVSV